LVRFLVSAPGKRKKKKWLTAPLPGNAEEERGTARKQCAIDWGEGGRGKEDMGGGGQREGPSPLRSSERGRGKVGVPSSFHPFRGKEKGESNHIFVSLEGEDGKLVEERPGRGGGRRRGPTTRYNVSTLCGKRGRGKIINTNGWMGKEKNLQHLLSINLLLTVRRDRKGGRGKRSWSWRE